MGSVGSGFSGTAARDAFRSGVPAAGALGSFFLWLRLTGGSGAGEPRAGVEALAAERLRTAAEAGAEAARASKSLR